MEDYQDIRFVLLDNLKNLSQNYESIIEGFSQEAQKKQVALTLAEEYYSLLYCILEFLELGLWSVEECRKIIEFMEDQCFMLELDDDTIRNAHAKEQNAVYFKTKLRKISTTRCKIITLIWIQMIDE